MKKLKINAKERLEVLTREQLRSVVGGDCKADDCLGWGKDCTLIGSICCPALDCITISPTWKECRWT